MAFSLAMPWSHGEAKVQELLHIPDLDNPTQSMLTPQASFMLQRSPLLAFGTIDSRSRPWTTLWGGAPGFTESLGGGMVGTRTLVDGQNDPVVQALVGDANNGTMSQPKGGGKLLAGLAIDLMARKRVKIAGRMVAGTLIEVDIDEAGSPVKKQDQIQIVTKIDQSLGNCPKYLNQYEIRPNPIQSKPTTPTSELSEDGKALINKADMFFMSSYTDADQDVNHRGGPQGFVRIISPTEIIYPEYSGNRFYQSLGNLYTNPKVGITFPDYETGNVLYITGTTEILVADDAASFLPGSNLAVKITIDEARFVRDGLPFRGVRKTPSPYNPQVRVLASEGNIKALASGKNHQTAELVRKTIITPSVARFTFSVPDGVEYKPGQWVAIDMKKELDTGYSHMREDDPASLNDDFVRTFTISSAPNTNGGKDKEFEMTVRKNGPVTTFLFQQNDRAGFEIPILGIGGEFEIKQAETGVTPFIAGGVGITPVLGQLGTLDLAPGRFKLLWTLRLVDVELVLNVLERHPQLAQSTEVFFTGNETPQGVDEKVGKLEGMGVKVNKRRLAKSDLDAVGVQDWYLCAAKPLRMSLLTWLEGKNVMFEDFDY